MAKIPNRFYVPPRKVIPFIEKLPDMYDRNFKREMEALRAEDEAVFQSDLTSLGMPVLTTIPPLPMEEEIRRAFEATDEINRLVQQAKRILETGKDE